MDKQGLVVKKAKKLHLENRDMANQVKENYKETYKMHCEGIEILRKQMVLVEVIKDICKVR